MRLETAAPDEVNHDGNRKQQELNANRHLLSTSEQNPSIVENTEPTLTESSNYTPSELLKSSSRQQALQANLLKMVEPQLTDVNASEQPQNSPGVHDVPTINTELAHTENMFPPTDRRNDNINADNMPVQSPLTDVHSSSFVQSKQQTYITAPPPEENINESNNVQTTLPQSTTSRRSQADEPTIKDVGHSEDERITTHKPGQSTENAQERAADSLLKDAQADTENIMNKSENKLTDTTAPAHIDDPTTRVAGEFVLKAISHTAEPWDKRAKVTFKLSKKSDIPDKPLDVVGIFGSLRKKKKRRKKREKKKIT